MSLALETASSQTAPEQENRWPNSLDNLERQMAAYRKLVADRASQAQIDEAAEQVSVAIRSISADSPPSYKVDSPAIKPLPVDPPAVQAPQKLKKAKQSSTWRVKNASGFFESRGDSEEYEKKGPFERAGRGVLVMLATPFAAAGMGLYASGMVLDGAAEMLKGLGSLGKYALVSARGKRRRRPSEPEAL